MGLLAGMVTAVLLPTDPPKDALNISNALPAFPTGLDQSHKSREAVISALSSAGIETDGLIDPLYNYARFFLGRSFVELSFAFKNPQLFTPNSLEYSMLEEQARSAGLTILLTPFEQRPKFGISGEHFLTVRANLVGDPYHPQTGYAEKALQELIRFVHDNGDNFLQRPAQSEAVTS